MHNKPKTQEEDARPTNGRLMMLVDTYLSDVERPKGASMFDRSDAADKTSVARAAAMLDEIKSENPILIKWKEFQTARLEVLAKKTGLL